MSANDQNSDLTDQLFEFIEALYDKLLSHQSSQYIAKDRRAKILLYVPENTVDLVVLTVELQLTLGMSYRLQRGIDRSNGEWNFRPIKVANDMFRAISVIMKYNPQLSVQSSSIRSVTNSVIKEIGIGISSLEFISVESRVIDIVSDENPPFGFVAHLQCFFEDDSGAIRSEALFWDVEDAEDWEYLLRNEIIPDQRRLQMKQIGSETRSGKPN